MSTPAAPGGEPTTLTLDALRNVALILNDTMLNREHVSVNQVRHVAQFLGHHVAPQAPEWAAERPTPASEPQPDDTDARIAALQIRVNAGIELLIDDQAWLLIALRDSRAECFRFEALADGLVESNERFRELLNAKEAECSRLRATLDAREADAQKPPMQPIVIVDGVERFRKNAIVRFLLDAGGLDMNRLAAMPGTSEVYAGAFSREDWEQFAQLIGYSIGGFSELSYVSDEAHDRASRAASSLREEP